MNLMNVVDDPCCYVDYDAMRMNYHCRRHRRCRYHSCKMTFFDVGAETNCHHYCCLRCCYCCCCCRLQCQHHYQSSFLNVVKYREYPRNGHLFFSLASEVLLKEMLAIVKSLVEDWLIGIHPRGLFVCPLCRVELLSMLLRDLV